MIHIHVFLFHTVVGVKLEEHVFLEVFMVPYIQIFVQKKIFMSMKHLWLLEVKKKKKKIMKELKFKTHPNFFKL